MAQLHELGIAMQWCELSDAEAEDIILSTARPSLDKTFAALEDGTLKFVKLAA